MLDFRLMLLNALARQHHMGVPVADPRPGPALRICPLKKEQYSVGITLDMPITFKVLRQCMEELIGQL